MERRVEDLEVKIAFLESTIDDLNDVLRTFADRVVKLESELKTLRETLDLERNVEGGHQPPPHY